MRHLRSACLLVLSMLIPTVANGFNMCASSGGFSTPSVNLAGIVFGAGVPAHVQSGMNGAAEAWNRSECNTSQNYEGSLGFPSFGVGVFGDVTITVKYHPGFGPVSDNDQSSTTCGEYNPSTYTVDIYGKHIFQGDDNGGVGYDCPSATEQGASRVGAHELGHFLGLANIDSNSHPDCNDPTGMVMGPAVAMTSGGQFAGWSSSSLSVIPQGPECEMADTLTNTPQEDEAEVGQCDQGIDNCGTSPIILNLNRGNLTLTGVARGVLFDLDADGDREAVAWTDADGADAFLWLDRNGNSVVDDGSELFGNHTPLADGTRASHGYLALIDLERPSRLGNGDLVITQSDPLYGQLRLWIDSNHDGESQHDEILSLSQGGVDAISLAYRVSNRRDRWGNVLRLTSKVWLTRNPAGKPLPGWCWDVFLQTEEE